LRVIQPRSLPYGAHSKSRCQFKKVPALSQTRGPSPPWWTLVVALSKILTPYDSTTEVLSAIREWGVEWGACQPSIVSQPFNVLSALFYRIGGALLGQERFGIFALSERIVSTLSSSAPGEPPSKVPCIF